MLDFEVLVHDILLRVVGTIVCSLKQYRILYEWQENNKLT